MDLIKLSKKKNVFENAKLVKNLFIKEIPSLMHEDILKSLNRLIMNEREIVKYDLPQEDYLVKDVLIRHKLNARWTYDLLKIAYLPDDMQYGVKQNLISVKEALKEGTKRKKHYVTSKYKDLIEDIRKAISEI